MAQTAASLPRAGDEVPGSDDWGQIDQGRSDWTFLLQVARPGLWTTTALFYLMPLGHADLWRADWSSAGRFWTGLAYILFPLSFLLYGVNDIVDAEADRGNPRKGTFLFGSMGRDEQLASLRWKIAAVQIPFLIAFFVWTGPRILLWFAGLLLAVALYNAPRIGWKGRPPFDVLIQGSYLLVFVLSSWVNGVAQLPWQTFVFGALFAMHSHIFGEVMDIGPDRAAGRKTTATRMGAVRSKFLIAAILCAECAMVWWWFRDLVIAGFLGAGVLWFVADALWMWKDAAYNPKVMKMFMLGWNAAAVLGIFWGYRTASLTAVKHLAGS
jgi:4-hydroxybenzoate polyprenyltransferase